MTKNKMLWPLALGMLVLHACTAQDQSEIAAIPSASQVKAHQVEAQQTLQQVFKMQESYFAANKQYGSDLGAIGVMVPGHARYQYALSSSGLGWTCSATANLDQDATLDRWVIDQTGRLTCTSDDARS